MKGQGRWCALGCGTHRALLAAFSLEQVTGVCFSPDESHCATCGEDGSVRIWALGSTELLLQFQVLNQVRLRGTSVPSLREMAPVSPALWQFPCRAASAWPGSLVPSGYGLFLARASTWWQGTAMALSVCSVFPGQRWSWKCTPTLLHWQQSPTPLMVRLPEVTVGTCDLGERGLVLPGFTVTSSCSVSWPPAQNPGARESHRTCVSELWWLCQLSTWWFGHGRCFGSGIAKGFGYNKHLYFMIYCLSSSVWKFSVCLWDISSYPTLDWDVPSLSQCFRTLVSHSLGPFSSDLFSSYKKCPILSSPLPSGEMILSGGKDGTVAVSSPRTGMTIHVLADHKGSPITVLQCTRKQVRPQEWVQSPSVTAQLWEAAWSASLIWCPLLFLFGNLSPSPPATSEQFFQGYIQWNKSPCVAGAAWVRLCLQGDLWLTPCVQVWHEPVPQLLGEQHPSGAAQAVSLQPLCSPKMVFGSLYRSSVELGRLGCAAVGWFEYLLCPPLCEELFPFAQQKWE